MDVQISILGSGDAAVLENVAADVFDNDVDSRLAAGFLADDRHHLAVAIDQGQVIGFASGVSYVHPDKPVEMWINEVGVAPEYQGKGIGSSILHALLQHAKTIGCQEAWVLTERTNRAAMNLYASTGGQEAESDPVMFTFRLDPGRGGAGLRS